MKIKLCISYKYVGCNLRGMIMIRGNEKLVFLVRLLNLFFKFLVLC